MSAAPALDSDRPRIEPMAKPVGSGLLKVVSMGFLSPEDEAIMWRGLMLNRGLQHFLEDVGGARWTTCSSTCRRGPETSRWVSRWMLPRAEMLIVTTPALAAQKVAVRAADMARKGFLRVAGVVENMSGFTCGHGERYELLARVGGTASPPRLAPPSSHAYRSKWRCRRRRPGRACRDP